MTHLTAERRVRAIFYWAHVLGVQGLVVEPAIRQYAQRAVATLQLLLIAVRGHRAYTSREWKIIFSGVGTQFFKAVEQLSTFLEHQEHERKRRRHQQDPDRNAAPVLFQPVLRSVYVHIVQYTLFVD